jgi:hypothetical protein
MWFAAKILFESSIRHDDGRVFQEQSIRLIQASDESEARAKAAIVGVSEQHNYPNTCSENVNWQFVSVLEVQDLCEAEIVDGMEAFSTMKWVPADPAEICTTVGESQGSH